MNSLLMQPMPKTISFTVTLIPTRDINRTQLPDDRCEALIYTKPGDHMIYTMVCTVLPRDCASNSAIYTLVHLPVCP